MKIIVKKLHKEAKVPTYFHPGDAGMDLYSLRNFLIKPNERLTCSTGISLAIPRGYAGLIWDKSGIASQNGIKTMAGVVDSGYRGEIKIVLINLSDRAYEIKKGQKIAQMLIQKVENPRIVESQRLSKTPRGKDGFGSTGML